MSKKMKQLGIEVNKVYNYFDDGKIRESRMLPVTITEIIPFKQINTTDRETFILWKEEAEDSHLYAGETDFFIKGNLLVDDGVVEKIVFVRTKNNRWFSLGYWAGQLDVDGSLFASIYLQE